MTQDKEQKAEPSVHSQPWHASGPTDIPAPGTDLDSRLRDLKGQMARAESSGDATGVDRLRQEIEKTKKEHPAVAKTPQQLAAEARRDAAQGDPDARTRAPQGRTPAPPKAPTGGTTAGKGQPTGGASAGSTGSGSSGSGKGAAGAGDTPAAKAK